ncbi:MAG: glycosyltransferase [Candidatus Omnitrophica bacterium]|nr:glycosyltransferase [Candidatus Omnitrophota bacterium]
MGHTLNAYAPFVGHSAIDELRLLADRLHGWAIRCVNATRVGGGVAEILTRMVPLCHELGVDMRWDVLEGSEPFFRVTKTMHNALHGQQEALTPDARELFLRVSEENLARLQLEGDLFFIHDPQPIAFVQSRRKLGGKWIWRCHIDVSRPQQGAWDFMRPFILQYDAAIFSAPAFAQVLPVRQLLIAPSIDPVSEKNRELAPGEVAEVLRELQIPTDWPIITQVSRFDYLKDPIGVIDAFRLVRRSFKCRLILAGGPASDDPEGSEVLRRVQEEAKRTPEIHVLMLPPNSDRAINALQRASSVVIQKSLREGFGLTVAEALWKSRPVVASAVGGIPLQVKHGYSGLLVRSVEGAARAIAECLQQPEYAAKLGAQGREHVRQNFLLTRHLREYLLAFLTAGSPKDVLEFHDQPPHQPRACTTAL